MKRGTTDQTGKAQNHVDLPSGAVREYIMDMLAELCVVAKQGKQEDLHALLKLAYQAASNSRA